MRIDDIRSAIIKRLREVKRESKQFEEAEGFDELQNMISKAILAVAECDTADDFESVESYLESVEELYNECCEEVTGEEFTDQLFIFDFELDEDSEDESVDEEDEEYVEDEYEESEDDEEYEEEDDTEADDGALPAIEEKNIDVKLINERINEIEDYFDAVIDRCTLPQKIQLKAIRKNAIEAVNAAMTDLELLDATRTFRRAFRDFTASLDREDAYSEAKKEYDRKSLAYNGKRLNTLRMILAFLALIGGAVYGFVLGWTSLPEWPIAIMGFGLSCLVLCVIYVISDNKKKAYVRRRMAMARIVLAVLFFIADIVIWIAFSHKFGILPLIFSTAPFTIGGIITYMIYRVQLFVEARKIFKNK